MRSSALVAVCVLLLAASVGQSAAAQDERGPRIVGGAVVTPANKYPFFVHIEGGCGGSLITENLVLTAAHCVDTSAPEDVRMRIGAHTLSNANDGERRTASRLIIHPQWNRPENANDVALVQFTQPSTRPTIDIADPADVADWAPGRPVTVIGHGATAQGGNGSNRLKELTVPVISDAQMESEAFYGTGFVPDVMLGAGRVAGGEDACQGDSGGPLFTPTTPPVQVGVVSWGEGCALRNKPGIYAEIGSGPLNTWLTRNLGEPAGEERNLPPRFGADEDLCGNIVAAPVIGGLTLEVTALDPEDEADVDAATEDVQLSFNLPSYATATQSDVGDNTAIGRIDIRPSIFDFLFDLVLGPRRASITATDNDGASDTCEFQIRSTIFGAPPEAPGGPAPR